MVSLVVRRRVSALAVVGAAFAGSAGADDVGIMNVTANVAPSCQLQAIQTLAFGTLNQGADNDAEADISWVCTIGYDSEVQLDGGASGDINARVMSGSLAYQLYTDSSRTQLFGDGSTGNSVPVTGTGYGTPATVTVYGRVTQAAASAAVAGNYSDTVNVTITF